ncbi:MAG: hypothetical protein ABI147_03075 [Acidobacteriaceae bacterium]
MRGYGIVMRDKNNRAALGIEFLQYIHDQGTCRLVQISRRLIRKDQYRVVDEGPGDGYPLLFPAGEFRSKVILAVGESDPRQGCGSSIPAYRSIGVDHWDLDIFDGGGLGQQIEGLKDEADLLRPNLRKLGVTLASNIRAVNLVVSCGRKIKAPEKIEECRFSGSR